MTADRADVSRQPRSQTLVSRQPVSRQSRKKYQHFASVNRYCPLSAVSRGLTAVSAVKLSASAAEAEDTMSAGR